jgi:nitrogen fixation protein NifU and related proteins
MSEALYNEAIVQEAKAARAGRSLAAPDARVTVDNPLCGDRVTVEVRLEDGRIAEVGHKARGCLLTEAATGVLARRSVGHTPAELAEAEAELEALLTGREGSPAWEELLMFTPVQPIRSRHECVRLPFEAMREALNEAVRKA